jgi:hypothetical protein
MKNKIFCIGLHKTGTCSLHEIAKSHGLNSTHSTNWQNNFNQINQFDFFCDGGSHYDNQKEIDFQLLDEKFENSKFIINIRSVKPWVISKLKHVGWTRDTIIQQDKDKYLHDEWRIKSKKNISLFIDHYYNRYIKIFEYFINKPQQAYYVDICANEIEDLKLLLQNSEMHIAHANKNRRNVILSQEVLEFIDSQILACKSKSDKLNLLIGNFKNNRHN